MNGNVCDNCYPHIRLLPTHPHLTSADFISLLPVATSAHKQIRRSVYCPYPIISTQSRPYGTTSKIKKHDKYVSTL